MTEEERISLFEAIKFHHDQSLRRLEAAFLHKEVTLIGTWPKKSRGRAARINAIMLQDGTPLFLCMVLRSGSDDVLNGDTWTRTYRPWGDFVLNDAS